MNTARRIPIEHGGLAPFTVAAKPFFSRRDLLGYLDQGRWGASLREYSLGEFRFVQDHEYFQGKGWLGGDHTAAYLVSEFVDAYFGPAAGPMRRYQQLRQQAIEDNLKHTRRPFRDADFIREARELARRAVELAEESDDPTRARILATALDALNLILQETHPEKADPELRSTAAPSQAWAVSSRNWTSQNTSRRRWPPRRSPPPSIPGANRRSG